MHSEPAMRLAKYLAARTALSRREAENAIWSGRVSVDRQPIITPAFLVTASSKVFLDAQPVTEAPPPVRLWRYHKPPHCLVTQKDPHGRPTIFSHLAPLQKSGRLLYVGRLDQDSEGLLLLTNTPMLAAFLEHPRNALSRQYDVHVHGPCQESALRSLEQGVTLDGMHYRPCRIEIRHRTPTQTRLHITMQEGKKREIRVLLQSLGYRIQRLIRIAYGPFELKSLPAAAWEEVPFKHFQGLYATAKADSLPSS